MTNLKTDETLSILLMTDRLDGGCPDGASCDYAHSLEELQEWTERRDFLRQKLTKAREDMLIMPDEFDFGKYNFLLQNWGELEPFLKLPYQEFSNQNQNEQVMRSD